MSQPRKKLSLKLKPSQSIDQTKGDSKEKSRSKEDGAPKKLRLKTSASQGVEQELSNLGQAFDQLSQKLNTATVPADKKLETINLLFSYYQRINEVIQKINQGVNQETIGNFSNQINHQENNQTYEINNEITLLNFGEGHLTNIIELFSDPDFINHIIRKDDFKNKYSVIVYDKKWDRSKK